MERMRLARLMGVLALKSRQRAIFNCQRLAPRNQWEGVWGKVPHGFKKRSRSIRNFNYDLRLLLFIFLNKIQGGKNPCFLSRKIGGQKRVENSFLLILILYRNNSHAKIRFFCLENVVISTFLGIFFKKLRWNENAFFCIFLQKKIPQKIEQFLG